MTFPLSALSLLLLLATGFALMGRALFRLRARACVIRQISGALSAAGADDFFITLTTRLRQHLCFDYVLVGEFTREDAQGIRILALCGHLGPMQPPRLEPELGEVLARPLCRIKAAAEALPPCELLATLGIQGLLSTPLSGQDGRALGFLMGLSRSRLKDRSFAAGVLGGFSAWVASELRHRRSESQLKRTRSMSDQLLDSIPTRVFWKDDSSTYLGCNKLFASAMGLESPEEVRGRTDFDLFPKTEARFHRFIDQRVLASPTPRGHYHCVHSLPDGTRRIMRMNKVPLLGEGGGPRGVLGIAQDVTDQRRTEKALRASERKLRGLLDSSLFGILVHRGGRPLYANETALRMSGQAGLEDWLALGSLAPLIDEAFEDELGSEFDRVERQAVACARAVFRARHPQEPALWIESSSRLLDWDGQGAVLTTLIDISARREATAQLGEKSRLMKTVLNAIPSPIFFKDEKGIYLGCNDAFANYLGKTRQEIVGRDVYGLSPQELARVYERSDRELMRQGGTQFYEARVRYADGSDHDVMFHKAVFRKRNGEPGGLVGCMLDISERKKAELALEEHRAQLEERVRQRTLQLQELNLQLSQSLLATRNAQLQLVEKEKFAALGSLVAGIAHEINTPVGVSITAATHLESRCRELLERFEGGHLKRSELERFLTRAVEATAAIHGNLRRAAELIHSFKQVAVDQADENRRRFNLREYLEEVLLSLGPALRKTRHRVHLECDPALVVDSFPGAFSQILTNLVQNSIQHGLADREAGVMNLSVHQENGQLQLRYSDNGCGMSPHQRKRLFEPFFTTRRGQGGSGLGMHIVYNLVCRTLEGQIRCDSEPDKGIYFLIVIPLSRRAAASERSEIHCSFPGI